MSESQVTIQGLRGIRPGRDATTGVNLGPGGDVRLGGRQRRAGGGEQPMVPVAEFRSYYGKPIINRPTWRSPDIPGYLFLGGLAGAGAVVAGGAQLTGRRGLARVSKVGSSVAVSLSLGALVHDLGRRERFFNMLRTFKPTSPMSVGSWLLAAFAPAATVSALSDLTGTMPLVGAAATAGAAVLGPGIATYTAALISNTAVPAWHAARRELPFLFASSATSAAAGLGLLGAPAAEREPVRRLAILAGSLEILLRQLMKRRMGLSREAYRMGKAKTYGTLSEAFTLGGVACAAGARRSRVASALAGTALLAGSAFGRFSTFEAGLNSADDPRYTVVPQRERLEKGGADGPGTPESRRPPEGAVEA